MVGNHQVDRCVLLCDARCVCVCVLYLTWVDTSRQIACTEHGVGEQLFAQCTFTCALRQHRNHCFHNYISCWAIYNHTWIKFTHMHTCVVQCVLSFFSDTESVLLKSVSVTFIKWAPSSHQTWCSRGKLRRRRQTHRHHTLWQYHRRAQFHQGNVIIKCLWVELQRRLKRLKCQLISRWKLSGWKLFSHIHIPHKKCHHNSTKYRFVSNGTIFSALFFPKPLQESGIATPEVADGELHNVILPA